MAGVDATHNFDRKCVHRLSFAWNVRPAPNVVRGSHLVSNDDVSIPRACHYFAVFWTEQQKESRADALLEILDPFAGKPSTFRTTFVGAAERLSAYSSQDSDRTVDRTTVPRRDPATRINLT
jgi:hypothetical protein